MNNFLRRCCSLETLLYIVFGILASLVNYAAYMALRCAGIYYQWSNALAWILSVIFAFLSNKFLVFKSNDLSRAALAREAANFFGLRLLTLFMEQGLLSFFVEILTVADRTAKIITVVIIGIINYFMTKLLIFKKP